MSHSSGTTFQGKRVLVTGGANGVGKSIVQKFYEAGAKVFALDKDEPSLKSLQADMPNVSIIAVDLTDWEASKKAIAGILPLDHLVNNAGIVKMGSIVDATPETFNLVMNVNLTGAYIATQAFAKGVIEHKTGGGTIVNVSSVGDQIVFPGAASYSCSKAALTMLTKAAGVELAAHNIRVNCVRPTGMQTDLIINAEASNPELFKAAVVSLSRQLIPAPLETGHVAEVVLFLSGPQASMMTGSAITIDCGVSIG